MAQWMESWPLTMQEALGVVAHDESHGTWQTDAGGPEVQGSLGYTSVLPVLVRMIFIPFSPQLKSNPEHG